MNREIKFRVWDTYNKEMLDVQELDYADSYNGQPMIRTTMYNDYFDTEEMILMQFTGLHDKNGKEIYEGDIVQGLFADQEEPEIKGQVIYSNGQASYIVIASNNDEWELGYLDNLEVIGNVFENGDILNDSKNTEKN